MPRAQAACSARASLSGGLAVGQGSECSGPASVYSGGSSSGGPHRRSCTSNGSGDRERRRDEKRRILG